MKMIVYTYDEKFTFQLAIELIPKGFEAIEANNREEIFNALKNDNINILVCECSDFEFLKQIKSINPGIYIFLIYHRNFKSDELVKIMKIGVTALIEYSDNPAIIVDDIMSELNRNVTF